MPMRLADPLPFAVDADLASRGASGIFDQDDAVPISQRGECREIARHAHLVNGYDRARTRGDCFGDSIRIDIVGVRIDVDEDRRGTAISDDNWLWR